MGTSKLQKTSGFLWPQLQIRNSKLLNRLGYCDRSSKSKPQNFKTLGIILVPAAIPNFKHFKNLFNSLITVANSQKFKTHGQAVALAANQNNNSEIAGLFCLQLEIKNSRQSLRIAASKRPRTSKPWQTNPKINPCHLITLEEKFQAKIWYNKWLNTCLLPSDITGQWAGVLLVTVQFSAPDIQSETVRHRQVLRSIYCTFILNFVVCVRAFRFTKNVSCFKHADIWFCWHWDDGLQFSAQVLKHHTKPFWEYSFDPRLDLAHFGWSRDGGHSWDPLHQLQYCLGSPVMFDSMQGGFMAECWCTVAQSCLQAKPIFRFGRILRKMLLSFGLSNDGGHCPVHALFAVWVVG